MHDQGDLRKKNAASIVHEQQIGAKYNSLVIHKYQLSVIL